MKEECRGACGISCRPCEGRQACGGCTHCMVPLSCTGACPRCPYICPRRPGAWLCHLDAGGSLEMPDSAPGQPALPGLPVYIPSVPCRLNVKTTAESLPMVAVHGGRALRADGSGLAPRILKDGVHAAWNLPIETPAVLHFYVPDAPIEQLWDHRHAVYPQIIEAGFNAVITPNFSVYEDSPRLEHLYGIRRSVAMYREMLASGIPAVPDISWYTRGDLDRWADFIQRCGVKTAAFSFQVVGRELRGSNAWRGYLLGLRYLARLVPGDLHFILVGLSSPARVRAAVMTLGGRTFSVLNSDAFVGARLSGQCLSGEPSTGLAQDEIFLKNFSHLEQIYRNIEKEECPCPNAEAAAGEAVLAQEAPWLSPVRQVARPEGEEAAKEPRQWQRSSTSALASR